MTAQLDEKLTAAQKAIDLPEVQEMVKRLAAYNLGVFMPHMHDETGNIEPLPEGIVQVEDDELRATFRPASEVVDTPEKTYLPVGWRWNEKTQCADTSTHCPMAKDSKGQWYHTGGRSGNN